MAELKHTEGAWIVNAYGNVVLAGTDEAGYEPVAHVCEKANTRETFANAQLIAAAPRMAKALIEVAKGNASISLATYSECVEALRLAGVMKR